MIKLDTLVECGTKLWEWLTYFTTPIEKVGNTYQYQFATPPKYEIVPYFSESDGQCPGTAIAPYNSIASINSNKILPLHDPLGEESNYHYYPQVANNLPELGWPSLILMAYCISKLYNYWNPNTEEEDDDSNVSVEEIFGDIVRAGWFNNEKELSHALENTQSDYNTNHQDEGLIHANTCDNLFSLAMAFGPLGKSLMFCWLEADTVHPTGLADSYHPHDHFAAID